MTSPLVRFELSAKQDQLEISPCDGSVQLGVIDEELTSGRNFAIMLARTLEIEFVSHHAKSAVRSLARALFICPCQREGLDRIAPGTGSSVCTDLSRHGNSMTMTLDAVRRSAGRNLAICHPPLHVSRAQERICQTLRVSGRLCGIPSRSLARAIGRPPARAPMSRGNGLASVYIHLKCRLWTYVEGVRL